MKRNQLYILFICTLVLFASCKKHYSIPTSFSPISERLTIYPDYTNIVIPPNIAPLNFMIRTTGDAFVVSMKCGKHKLETYTDSDGKIMMDSVEWRSLLQNAKGKKIIVQIFVLRDNKWFAFSEYSLQVALEPIDAYLSYRLIEPGYELYRQLGLYQRNLTTFDVHTIYENNRKYDEGENHCINCHNYQNYDARTMLFHVRSNMGGTLIAKNGSVEKMNMKSDSIISSAVYPSWHPKKNWIVFSSNKTGQTFHILDKEKVEVLDHSSDLIFYNADTKQISNILKTEEHLETFPCWSPKGDKVYYCDAYYPILKDLPDSVRPRQVVVDYKKLRYDLKSITFDAKTQTFGEPQLEVDAQTLGKSIAVPRVSPDGRYVLFTAGDYGQFHIWHKSSDLYVKDLVSGKVYPLNNSNSWDADSYHSWSSNGRWFVFSSRRDDGSFTRPYFAYFDTNGKSYKAFMLPHQDPEQSLLLYKSYNVPELTRNAVPFTFQQFKDAIYNQEGTPVTYKEIRK